MKKPKLSFLAAIKIFILYILVLTTNNLSAQTGILSGKVIDGGDKSPLPGVTVTIKEIPTIGASTDIDGMYSISGIPVGKYTLVYTFIYYATKEIPVEVSQGVIAPLEVEMAPESVVGEEVIITAQALGQSKAINQQLNSDAIANIVSADKIKELPDVNAAEAISRLPGVAINRSGGEGSKVVVRGLDPKFTTISINGVRLPSTSGSDRSVDLALISPELLSGIELFKSPTPDMDGDALGGAVNLSISRAPKERKISIKGLGGYNDLGKTTTDYKFTGTYTGRFLEDKIGLIATYNQEQFNRSGQTTNQSWSDDLKVVLDSVNDIFAQQGNNLSYVLTKESRKRRNASLGLDFKVGNSEFNALGIYSNTSRNRYVHREDYNVAANRLAYFPGVVDNSIDLYSGSLSGITKLNKITLDYGASYSKVIGKTPVDFDIEFRNDRNAFSAEASTSRDNPSRFFGFATKVVDREYLQGISFNESGNNEEIKTGYLNFNLPLITNEKISINFKTGAKYVASSKDRFVEVSRNARQYYLYNNSYFADYIPDGVGAIGVDPSGTTYYGMSNFTSNESLSFRDPAENNLSLLGAFDVDKLRKFRDVILKKTDGNVAKNHYSDTDDYDLTESVFAKYAMLKIKLGKAFTIIPGVRHESSDNKYNGLYADLNGDLGQNGIKRNVSDSVKYGVLLPHLHLKYKPTDWFDIRASYSTTLARPDFDYLIPFTQVNRSGELRIERGNSQLKPSVSQNLDLYFTFHTNEFGLLSIGGFNKRIKDVFYSFTVGLNNDSLAMAYGFPAQGFVGGDLQTYVNSPDSYVRGLEFEYQSNLNFLPGFFKKFVVTLNYSRLFSQTTINSFYEETVIKRIPPFTVIRQIFLYPIQREVDLVGQAPHIFNASLGFDHKGFSTRVSSSYQGNKISGYSASLDKDRYNKGFWRFDLALKQKFGNNFNVFLNINNISDQQDINFFRNESFMTSTSRYGSTATFGAEYIIR